MVWVLEGTSVGVGGQVAASVQTALSLPDSAMTYLTSHSTLDQLHIQLFERLMNQVTDPDDQAAVIDGANMVFRLYGQMLHSLSSANTNNTRIDKDKKTIENKQTATAA
jgi:long-chain acyl-CoA synthetase